MKQVHILTAAAAMALGISGTLITNGITAKAAVSRTEYKTYSTALTTAQQSTIENFIEARACPAMNADFGLTGADECTVAKNWDGKFNIQKIWNEFDENGNPVPASGYTLKAVARMVLDGEFTPGNAP